MMMEKSCVTMMHQTDEEHEEQKVKVREQTPKDN